MPLSPPGWAAKGGSPGLAPHNSNHHPTPERNQVKSDVQLAKIFSSHAKVPESAILPHTHKVFHIWALSTEVPCRWTLGIYTWLSFTLSMWAERGLKNTDFYNLFLFMGVSLKPEFLYSFNKKRTTAQRLGRHSCLTVQTRQHGILKKVHSDKNHRAKHKHCTQGPEIGIYANIFPSEPVGMTITYKPKYRCSTLTIFLNSGTESERMPITIGS